MKPQASFFRKPVNTEPRLQLCIPCQIVFTDHALQGVTFNISYSGVGVELPPTEKSFDARSLKSISIPDIGDFAVVVQWRRRQKMGLSFLAKKSAKPQLRAYFKKLGNYPF